MTWTPPQLVAWIKDELARRGLEGNLRLEAELLVAKGLGCSRLDIFLKHDQPLEETERAAVRDLVRRRFNREPLGYVLGEAHFWSIELAVGPGVLCPRPDTETLVEVLLELAPKGPLKAAELGLGSGAISLALAVERGQLTIDGVEKSPQAAAYALTNRQRLREKLAAQESSLEVIEADGLSGLEGPYDLLYSNPPYVTADEWASLEPEVKDHEPEMALVAPEEGLAFYSQLFAQGLRLLRPGGILAFEHGFSQQAALKALAPEEYELLRAQKDLAGNDRVLAYRRR